MISIVSTNFRMSGSYINHLDTYDFLRDLGVKYYYMDNGELPLWEMLLKTGRNYNLQNPIKIGKTIEDDIIITDFRGIIVLNHENVKLSCERLIVMDCMELTFHLNRFYDVVNWFFWFDEFTYETPIYRYLNNIKFNDIKFLMPPSNYSKFCEMYFDLYPTIFFKKINVPVLLKHRNIEYFDRDTFVYERKKEKRWHDQFGRTIFEFIILGKKVVFKNNPFMVDDGVSDYLKYYKIEFEGNKVKTTAEELDERMKDDGRYLRPQLLL